MEYVGEVLDPRQFRKRAKKFAKEDVKHFYFMALSAEYCIDASHKGNISRFINHSCDPNAETQKVFIYKPY
jgi:SET domain-containing protein